MNSKNVGARRYSNQCREVIYIYYITHTSYVPLSYVDPENLLTVLCSSPSLTWNVCSKMVYMILPMPKEGSITFGTTSSTVDNKDRQVNCSSEYPDVIFRHHISPECISPCRVFWNRFTLTISFVSLNIFPSVSMVNSLWSKK